MQIELPTGTLEVEVHASKIPMHDLLGFAARRNPKRGFLFVSKVLGKHIPAKPSLMRSVTRELAHGINAGLPGPVLFIAMAETATGFGQSVFEDYVRKTGRDDVLFLHSTRYQTEAPVALAFEEKHSHATDHIVYFPQELKMRDMMTSVRSLVLVDDEASTGNTMVNLVNAFTGVCPKVASVTNVVITDWRTEESCRKNAENFSVDSSWVALLDGAYSFSPTEEAKRIKMPVVTGNGASKDDLLCSNFGSGRNGVSRTTDYTRIEEIALGLSVDAGQRILVLGTGEFAYPPFLLAETLERMGMNVKFQSTTRSPIMVGHAIGEALEFTDNYGDGMPNFVYNVRRRDYDRIIIGHETPVDSIDRSMVQNLDAELVLL